MPSHDKALIKQGTAHDIGCKLDDQMEAAEKLVLHLTGAASACAGLIRKIQSLASRVDEEVDAGTCSLSHAKEIKKYISLATHIAESETNAYRTNCEQAKGSVRGLRQAVETVKKVHDEETAKLHLAERPGPDGGTPEERREARRSLRKARKSPEAKASPTKSAAKKSAKIKPKRAAPKTRKASKVTK